MMLCGLEGLNHFLSLLESGPLLTIRKWKQNGMVLRSYLPLQNKFSSFNPSPKHREGPSRLYLAFLYPKQYHLPSIRDWVTAASMSLSFTFPPEQQMLLDPRPQLRRAKAGVSAPAEKSGSGLIPSLPSTLFTSLQDPECVGTREVFGSWVATFPLSRTLDCQQLVDSNVLFFQPCTLSCKASFPKSLSMPLTFTWVYLCLYPQLALHK